MSAYRTPGVYFEWPDSAPAAIGPVRTDIAGFVGIAERGPLFQAVKVESWTQFITTFGGFIPQGYLAYAVEGFFANGGRTCWVVRVADENTARRAEVELKDDQGQLALRLCASSPGVWGRRVRVSVSRTQPERFTLTALLPDGRQEVWRDLTMKPKDEREARSVLNTARTGSRLLAVVDSGTAPPRSGTAWLAGGQDGLAPSLDLKNNTGKSALRLIAAGRCDSGQKIRIKLESADEGYFTLTVTVPNRTQETWPRLTLRRWQDADQRVPDLAYVVTVLNDQRAGSRLIVAQDLGVDTAARLSPVDADLGGGLDACHLGRGLAVLADQDQVSILAMPDIMPKPYRLVRSTPMTVRCDVEPVEAIPAWAPIAAPEFAPAFTKAHIACLQNKMVGQCENLKDRVAILDAPRFEDQDLSPIQAAEWRKIFDTKYAALYYPWLRVSDHLGLGGLLCDVPPSGHVAGVYARVERTAGVHQPPANVELTGVQDVSMPLGDDLHGILNDQAVNVLRTYSGRGIRLAGARTLSSDSSWRYINVRRLLIMIEKAIDRQTQWIVFEPNNPDQWREVDRVVRDFLNDLWQRGMLDGATAADAYSVTCDGSTNPPQEVEAGRVICRIGVQPPWPAEFVVVRIGKTEGGTQVIGTPEAA